MKATEWKRISKYELTDPITYTTIPEDFNKITVCRRCVIDSFTNEREIKLQVFRCTKHEGKNENNQTEQ